MELISSAFAGKWNLFSYVLGWLIQAVLSAYSCFRIAKSKGLESETWAVRGYLLGLFALIAIAFVPSKLKDGQK